MLITGSNECGFVSVEYNRQDKVDLQDECEDPNVILSCQDPDNLDFQYSVENLAHIQYLKEQDSQRQSQQQQQYQQQPQQQYQQQQQQQHQHPSKSITSTYV